MKKFETDVRDYYEVKESNCGHNGDFVLWLQDVEEHGIYSFETDGWNKFSCCKKCCELDMESAACGGNYMNYRLFQNEVDISNQYDLRRKQLETDVLKFYWCKYYDSIRGDNTYYSFVLRKKDFFQFYEDFFYNQLKQWRRELNHEQIETTLNAFPDKKNKFWNVQISDLMPDGWELNFDYFQQP